MYRTDISIEEADGSIAFSVIGDRAPFVSVNFQPQKFQDPRIPELERALTIQADELSRERMETLKVLGELAELRRKKATPKKAQRRR